MQLESYSGPLCPWPPGMPLPLWGRKWYSAAASSQKGSDGRDMCAPGNPCLCHYTPDLSFTRKALGEWEMGMHWATRWSYPASHHSKQQSSLCSVRCTLSPPPLKPLSHSGWCALGASAVLPCGMGSTTVPGPLDMSVHPQTEIVGMVSFSSKGFLMSYRLRDLA